MMLLSSILFCRNKFSIVFNLSRTEPTKYRAVKRGRPAASPVKYILSVFEIGSGLTTAFGFKGGKIKESSSFVSADSLRDLQATLCSAHAKRWHSFPQ